DQECGRRLAGYRRFGRQARIDEPLEIRPGFFAIDGIGGPFDAGIETGGGKIGKLSSGGESDNADACGIDAPLFRPVADQADGALRVLQRMDLDFVDRAFLSRQAVFEDKAGHARAAEESGDVISLRVDRQESMPPPGITITAAPVDFSFGGRNTVTLGL